MKRTLALLATAALAASPVVADAAKKPVPTKRTVTWSYQGVFGAYATPAGGGGVCGANPNACFELPTTAKETKVTFTVTDATGQKTPLQYAFDGDYQSNELTCSSGDIPVKKGTLLSFYMVATDACPGLPTQGKVTFTITGTK